MHQSRCSISSSCCFFNSTTILSISSFTLVKASRRIVVASKESLGECDRPAANATTLAARRCRSRCSASTMPVDVCRKNPFTVLSKFSKALSSLTILMVSSTAVISAIRFLMRVSNSASLSEHFFSRFPRNSVSNASCLLVSASCFFACTFFSPKSANSSSNCTTSFLPAAISSSLAAFIASKSFTAFTSSSLMVPRLFFHGSLICFKMPKISPL
mmetsp:Transcript_21900/g.69136  ORF Transcript_21900/g.69136 Transcript_21900/m.69136 type:complete len:215 (-) Transcript_21900:736-1380(-)